MSLLLAITILVGTWSLMRESLNLMLDAVPDGIDPADVKALLGALPGVVEVHDLHIWAMSTIETALTAHLMMPGDGSEPTFVASACKKTARRVRRRSLDSSDRPARGARPLRSGLR